MKSHEKLQAYWSKKENDLMLYCPMGVGTMSDGRYLSSVFSKEVLDELNARGYDTTTLKFSIEPQKGNQNFASQRKKDAEM